MDDMAPMGKGPGGSNDVSELLRQAARDYQAGKITKQQYLDHLDYYAPASVPDTMQRLLQGQQKAQDISPAAPKPKIQIGNRVYY